MVKTIHSQMSPDATVLQMLQKLHGKLKQVPIHEMQLTYNNSQLEEDKSLAHYGIGNGSTVILKTYSRTGICPCEECKRMEQKVTIMVTGLQKSIKVECKLGEPVEALKKAIKDKEKIAVAKQRLTLKGVELQDHKLLGTYKFGDEETGGVEPVVHLFVNRGDPTILDKLRSKFSFKAGTSSAPAAAAH